VKVLGKIDKPKKGCGETDQQVTDSAKFTKIVTATDETETPEQAPQV
jgi:hypothetical protein